MFYQKASLLPILGLYFLANLAMADIIMFYGVTSHSQKNTFLSVAQMLGVTGHKVTLISPFPPQRPKPNVQEFQLKNFGEAFKVEQRTTFLNFAPSASDIFFAIKSMTPGLCHALYQDPKIAELLDKSRQRKLFDIAIISPLYNDCTLTLAHKLAKFIVYLSPNEILPFTAYNLNIPAPYSYVTMMFSTSFSNLNFFQRLKNTAINLLYLWLAKTSIHPSVEEVARQYYPDMPSVQEIEKNVSLVLLNRVAAVDSPHPSLPFVKEIGGIHCRNPMPLPTNLAEFVNNSPDGFIYVSFSTHVDDSLMPEYFRDELLKAFSKIPLRIVWKNTYNFGSKLPPNVKQISFAPQQDLLGHKKIRAFITHGGHASVSETIYHGVPIIGIPFFADQPTNIEKAVLQGFCIRLDWQSVSEDDLVSAVNEIISNPKYKQKAKDMSLLLKDQNPKSHESVVFWMEYIMRHNGAKHLHPQLDHLSSFEYFLLDLILAFLLFVLALLMSVWFGLKSLWKRLTSKKKSGDSRNSNNSNKNNKPKQKKYN